ncbi:MAG: 50S ribosomal protein L37ae [Candidatus Thermoplasmatota archaeon]|nr:50S ribosomal protein L37ae [Euryarchaeota archaeon]MBU4031431.1 50S ribosomal protein L37ae [Candidatus Thermoplasmatota archaeon]MBU4071096.1 50S ribosomal protein L37ae [Candidatus Thermoplasmatota archaeon]MBU4144978.1 50S ribosomal protein L37ae [Candidatus Thermoplasmatota archaeon]MBU4591116.1 50S ribosomal protein L37ae [Candidatus Thermoplasmatota archaeon]
MAKRTNKAGMTGKFGARYGVKIRKQIKSVSRHRARPSRCPECQNDSVKRLSSGIWTCKHCGLKFAASAYSIRVRSYTREEAQSQAARFKSEDATNLAQELGKEPVPEESEELLPEKET